MNLGQGRGHWNQALLSPPALKPVRRFWAAMLAQLTFGRAAMGFIRSWPLTGRRSGASVIQSKEKARILLIGPRPSLYGIVMITLFSAELLWRER